MLLLFVLSYNLRIMRIICAIPRMNDELCEFRVDRSMLNVETGWVVGDTSSTSSTKTAGAIVGRRAFLVSVRV